MFSAMTRIRACSARSADAAMAATPSPCIPILAMLASSSFLREVNFLG